MAATSELEEHLFGGLSISSLDSGNEDGNPSDEELSTQTELYQRLQDLDEMTGSFLHGRPLLLNSTYASYADLEPGQSQEFKLVLPSFDVSEVLTISVACLGAPIETQQPTIESANDENAQNIASSLRFQHEVKSKFSVSRPSFMPIALSLYQLRRTDVHNRTLSPTKSDYVYEIRPQSSEGQAASGVTGPTGLLDLTLTAADGISAGIYFLRLTSLVEPPPQGAVAATSVLPSQQVRLSHHVHPSVRAADIQPDEAVRGAVCMGQTAFFRYTHSRAHEGKLITIKVLPLTVSGATNRTPLSSSGLAHSCDPDLYVSNAHGGLVGVTREAAQWKSVSAGCDRVDIHPSDPQIARGSVFVIGVVGHRENNPFELSVALSEPPMLHDFQAAGGEARVSLLPGQSQYFVMRLPPAPSRVILSVVPFSSSLSIAARCASINTRIGRACYCTDSLPSLTSTSSGMDSATSSANLLLTMPPPPPAHVPESTTPPGEPLTTGSSPLLYLSAHAMYPNAEYHCWRASAADSAPVALLETDEWPHTSTSCFFALHAHPDVISAASVGGEWMISSSVEMEEAQLTGVGGARYTAFQEIFQDIDGSVASQRDRAGTGPGAGGQGLVQSADHSTDGAFTYGEVTYLGMLELLGACGWGVDRGAGGVFYDLGCGSGKAVIAAALSGNLDGTFSFSRCAGVELLPSLVACAQTAVSRFQEKVNGDCLGLSGPPPEMLIWHGDVAACSLEAADVVFVSSVCFPDALLSSIVRNAASMRKGSVLATLRLPASFEAETAAAALAIVSTCWVKMSWARVQVHILRKV